MPSLPRGALLDGSFHHHLLSDGARLDAWAAAVKAAVRPGDVVADLGSGSGILAALAVRAGARKVFAVEANSHSYAQLLRNVKRNDLVGRVVPVLADASSWTPQEGIDLVLCEMVETGLLHEPLPAAMRRVREWGSLPRDVLPSVVRLDLEGVAVDDDFLGYRATAPGFRTMTRETPVTARSTYATYDLRKGAPPERIDARVNLVATSTGLLDALRLVTETDLGHGIVAGESPGYCTPIVLPLDTPRAVKNGETLAASIRYGFAFGPDPIEYDLT